MRLFAGTPFDIPPTCERCGALEENCKCPPLPTFLPPEKQTAKLRVEKRPRGKHVTLVVGLAPDASDLPSLLTTLKNACGAGGSCKDGQIEIQGDHLERVGLALRQLGYRVSSKS
jgi:translation initiation factor 1